MELRPLGPLGEKSYQHPFLTAFSLCLALVPSPYLFHISISDEELSKWKLLPIIHSFIHSVVHSFIGSFIQHTVCVPAAVQGTEKQNQIKYSSCQSTFPIASSLLSIIAIEVNVYHHRGLYCVAATLRLDKPDKMSQKCLSWVFKEQLGITRKMRKKRASQRGKNTIIMQTGLN